MAALGTILMLVSAVLVGVASFLYNDGHDHTFVGKVSAGIGALALGASWLAQSQQTADEQYDCPVYKTGCDKNDSLIEAFGFDEMFIGIIVEFTVVLCCSAAGLVVAKLTSRQRADGKYELVGLGDVEQARNGRLRRDPVKRCRRCGETKPTDDFFAESRKRDGLQSWCRACKAESGRRWRERNREAYNAARRIDPYPPRICATCGQEFSPLRRDQRYCCRWCREHRYLTRIASGLPPDNLSLGKRT